MQHDILGADARGQRAGYLDAQGLRHGEPHSAGDKGVGHVGGSDAEGDATERAAMRSMRIGANNQLARQGVVFRHQRMRNALRP